MGDYIREIRGLIGHRPFIMAGSAVIVLNGRREILLQHRSDTEKWGIPGGAMEPGESFEEAARRGLYEETGLMARDLEFLDLLSGKEYYFQYPNGDEIYNAIALYKVDDWEGEVKINDEESLELRFFSMDDLPELEGRPARIVHDLYRYGLFPDIREINIQESLSAALVFELQWASYKKEAELIGTDEIPPLLESFEQLKACGELFLGYFDRGELAGAVSYKVIENQIDIHRVMVHPEHFRKGIARSLIEHLAIKEGNASEMLVATGAANTPAVKLYQRLGFTYAGETIAGQNLQIAHFRKSL
ncbi:ADP-ribose pyrophosphatase YjhB (NUDIX family) [Mesobacillus foraminis]|uniref:ADP-ribose pyrophosphatase YjhB (NUDIX family) n=1 Tax=Mesobacillus foraminis TaxID=279826 RepID=A0A4V2RCU0_9BACI|nr:ADP-ribose pyrophosphatase YjhB (NUDIX family) [Mesobacillus foraminis]